MVKISFFCTGEEKHGTEPYQRVMLAMDVEASRHGLLFYQPIMQPDDKYHCCIVSGSDVIAEGISENPVLAALRAWDQFRKKKESA